jgi:hypothetical protein
MPLVLAGATSGSATVQATDAQTVTMTLPATSGTLVVTGGAQTIEFADGSAAAPSITNSGDTNTGMFFPAADTIAFTEGGAESMRIDSSGNVGIGTSSLASKLHVQGEIRSSTAGNTQSTRIATDGVYSAGTDLYLYAPSSYANIFYTNATERMRITSGGNLAVGTTSLANASARAAIVNSGGGSIVMQIQRSGENVSYIGSDNADIFSVWDSAPTKRFAVTSAGSCQNTTGSYGTISDVKLKENIVDATPKLEKVMQLQVKNYAFKSNPEFKQIGFIAQELQQIFPSLIEENPDEDENGEKTGEITLGVKTTVLIPILVKAIQELNAKVDAQAARIAVLEGTK